MKYVYNNNIFEAFRIGIDPIPDWFMDKVTKNEAVLCEDDWHNTRAKLHSETNMEYFVNYGDYIMRDPEGAVCGFTKSYVDSHHTRIIEDEPVNAAEPVDPEKERLNALGEYYYTLATECRTAYKCFISAGFREDEAFTLLMKLMEQPVKPLERSREDVIRDFNRWKNARKERVNND